MTHKKIAQIAHVSPSTVSKALSGSKEVSPSLAAEIRRIAVETGYFKEKSKRKLDNLREQGAVVAVICPEIVSVHYSEIVNCIKSEVESRGGKVLVSMYDFDLKKLTQTIESIEVNREADGIILISESRTDIVPSLPVVCYGGSVHSRFDTVYSDGSAIMNDIAGYLKSKGHTHIGYVGETHTTSKNNEFRCAMDKHGLEIKEEDIYIIDRRFEQIGFEAAKQMMKKQSMPTAIVTAYDEVAMGIIRYFTDNGVSVPQDVSVVGINNIPYAAYSQIPLTTVDMHPEDKCSILVSLLFDKMYGDSKVVQHVLVEHTLVERETVKEIR
ncbi:MAG: LacI family DNA-binding transcriptional regulator [Clostridia bacterium]|nr:LacI family DNA-binding transcriptional regulator [Clostridia bacterium]